MTIAVEDNTTDDPTTVEPDPAATEPDADGAGNGDRPMSREQRYRMSWRAAEAERDALAAQVEAFQRAEVERLAADLAQPGDLFDIGGASLADLLTEAGGVDNDAVAEAVAALIEQRPGLSANPTVRATDPSQGRGGGTTSPKPSFGDMLQAARKS